MIEKCYRGILCSKLKSFSGYRSLRAVLLFGGIASGSLLFGQNNVQISNGNASLSKIISDIEKQTEYLFFYNNDIDVAKVIKIKPEKASLNTILDQIEANSDVACSIEGKNILLSKKKPAESAISTTAKQNLTITGRVRKEDGEGLAGVTVKVLGENKAVATDNNGSYSITLSSLDNRQLEFSLMGYDKQTVRITNNREINITLTSSMRSLDEVVVTALGIKKKEKSLTYSTQKVDNEELVRAKDPNLMNNLAGKVSGVQINRSASGLGGSVKVTIRGERSVSGNNQPLYVIDGIPINSGSNNQTATSIGGNNDAGNRDGGDGISNLNPEDIESMNILKGPAAAALYGSAAANGVIVITTKKGAVGKTNITLSSNTTWETAAYGIPKFQNSYGGVTASWGDPIAGSPSYTDDFFNTGSTTINALTLSSGSDKMQAYFSYANTLGKGVIGNNKLEKHNVNFRETANLFNQRLTLDGNVNLLYQKVKNRPSPGGFYMNPLVGLYRFPRGGVQGGESFDYYRDNYKVFNKDRNLYVQNWYTQPNSFEQNPYWLTNMIPNEDKRYRTLGAISASYKLSDHFTVQTRGNADFVTDYYDSRMYAGTDPSITGGTNGRYVTNQSHELNLYGDFLVSYNQTWKDFALSSTIGTSILDKNGKNIGFDSYPGGLYLPNVFSAANINHNGSSPSLGSFREQTQSVFFAGQLGFKDQLFLDVTGRNDWTSTLAYTKYKNKGFFYPSIGISAVLQDMLQLPEWVTLGKIRGAWSEVGNGLPRYLSMPLNTVGRGGVINFNTTQPFDELKPEKTASIELGTEWRFFNSRLELDFTYYKTNTRDQLFSLPAPTGSKYTTYYVNAGNIQNQGVEIMLNAKPVVQQNFKWTTGVNFSLNRNKIIELVDGLGPFNFAGTASNSYAMRLEVGGSFGDIYGRGFLRDDSGNIQYDSKGIPIPDKSDYKKVGNTAPKFMLGWQNGWSYKNINLNVLVDGRFGGKVMSLTEAELDKYGVSERTGNDRLNGGVNFDGKNIADVQAFYAIVGGRDGVSEHYIYDATNIRMREISLGYTIPKDKLAGQSVIKSIDLSLIGRNLFFITNKAPYDVESSLSVGNSLQGLHVFGAPGTRSFGFNIKVNF